ncbi:MAG: ATP-binding cassette domain-containing protein [Anaerolineae bacterium]|nr:ATP-binding cassette domain-containing protein [Anaerolineae bacterium]
MPHAEPVQALRGVDLDIAAGEYVAVVGANGSGKTTLARHLNALLLPTAGDVWIDGRNTHDPAAIRAIRADVQMVFQSPADQIVATVVQEDVAFGPENLGVPVAELPLRVREALERVSMWPARHRPPHMLSAGQQQRVAVAGALAMRPRCIVFDEAAAMLDPAGRRDLLQIIDALHAAGLTVITITHAMEEAARAGRVVVMHQGRIVFDGSPTELFTHPDLSSWSLLPPPVVQLAARLRAHIPDLPPALTIDELVAALQGAVR